MSLVEARLTARCPYCGQTAGAWPESRTRVWIERHPTRDDDVCVGSQELFKIKGVEEN